MGEEGQLTPLEPVFVIVNELQEEAWHTVLGFSQGSFQGFRRRFLHFFTPETFSEYVRIRIRAWWGCGICFTRGFVVSVQPDYPREHVGPKRFVCGC